MIEHSGGIHGFRSYAIRIPDEHIYVAVLSNNGAVSPTPLAFKMAAWLLGKPYTEPTPVELGLEVMRHYEGLYQVDATNQRRIRRQNGHLVLQVGQGDSCSELIPFSSNEFFLKENPFYHLTFIKAANGTITALEMRGRTGIPETARKINEPVPETGYTS